MEHTHKFASEWKSDETKHWHASTCGHEVTEGKTSHTFGDWITTKAATEEAEGSKERTCTVCGYKATEVIEKLAHTHKVATDWTKDETNHWHAVTCGCSDVELQKTEHTFGEWEVTKEPTEDAKGTQKRVCNVCKYKETAEIDQLEHKHVAGESWKNDDKNHWKECTGCKEQLESAEHEYEWIVTKEATCTEKGSKTGTCKVCKKEVTEKIPAKGHSYSESLTKDASGHWYECFCGAKKDFEEHTYGTWNVTTEPTTTQEGRNERTCKDCAYIDSVVLQPAPKGFRFVKGVTITGTESWTPSSKVFVSERKLTIPDLIVSDHEVTRGEYKAVMGSDPSTAGAYDKNGNELEGDAVLNNPVNYVNWYDAIVYCNKRSMAEDLTPCYSINGSTNPNDWGKVPSDEEDSSRTKWDAVICNWNANGYRLPTEAEWEWLARGGENYEYAGSNRVSDVAYTSNTNDTGTREVKTKAPNGYGLYDMSGNVWEWCWDWYGGISYSTAADGATSGDYRVNRGGSWLNHYYYSLVAGRGLGSPYYRNNNNGFRVVRQAN